MSGERLFFALWPDEAVRAALARQAKPLIKHIEGRPVPQHNWHVTVYFLGATVAKKRQFVEMMAGRLRTGPFVLHLDRLGCWPRSGVVWLGASQIPAALFALRAELAAGLAELGWTHEGRAFEPHLTLLRKAACPRDGLPAPEPVSWRVDRFVLVRSRTLSRGARYEVVGEWELCSH